MQGKQPGRRLAQSWPLAPGLGEGHVLRHQGSRINGSAEERGEFSFLYFHLRQGPQCPEKPDSWPRGQDPRAAWRPRKECDWARAEPPAPGE